MTLKELLTVYWGQTTLVLAAIAFFIQRGLNLKAKRLEINHSLFQQNRLEAVNDFFTNYARNERMWVNLSVYDILNRNLEAKEIDEIIYPTINDISKNVYQLQIYFEEKDHKIFQEILNNVKKINSGLLKIYFEPSKENTVFKANAFSFIMDENLQKNEVLLKQLASVLKRNFN